MKASEFPVDLQYQVQLLLESQTLEYFVRSLDKVSSFHSGVLSFFINLVFHWPSSRSQVLGALSFSQSIQEALWEEVLKEFQSSGSILYAHSSFMLFVSTLEHRLKLIDDDEFYGSFSSSLNPRDIVRLLRSVLFECCWNCFFAVKNAVSLFCINSAIHSFQLLYDRQNRRRFCEDNDFQMSGITSSTFEREVRNQDARSMALYKAIPFVVSFDTRLNLFYNLIREDRDKFIRTSLDDFGMIGSVSVKIRRDYILEDSFETIMPKKERIKGRLKVEFVNSQGIPEAGIDGGGLFKEFLTRLCQTAFNPNYGLFGETDDHLCYPSHDSVVFDDPIPYIAFLGMILGKAIYENILVEPQFANFFLRKLVGKFNYLDDLYSLDSVLYKNLIFLKNYRGDFKELGLTFSINDEVHGERRLIDLVPGGSEIAVTFENRLRYIHLVADYKLNKQIKAQSSAFLSGLSTVFDPSWLRVFSVYELQMIISGSKQVDVRDWIMNTNYQNRYSSESPQIIWFWDMIHEMKDEDRAAVLRFATSCSRAPLLGFKSLTPPFTIACTDSHDDTLLPTSSTCFNLLRIPTYSKPDILFQKLLYAIKSNSGFELS